MLILHVGLHKTATTFFQNAVFPLWTGIEYIPWPNLEVFLRLDERKTYLCSREGLSGRNWYHHAERDACLRRLSEMFPEARILLSFRGHAGYIVSSYRHYLQWGGVLPLEEYVDLGGDAGFMTREDFLYRSKVESVRRHFKREPFVFLFEEIHSDLTGLLQDMQAFVGGNAPAVKDINMKSRNRGIGFHQASLLRKLNAISRTRFNPDGRYDLYGGKLRRLRLDPRSLCDRWLAFLPDKPFLGDEARSAIDAYYRDDWDYVQGLVASRRSSSTGTTADEARAGLQ